MSSYYFSNLELFEIQNKTIISVNQSFNSKGEVIEVIIKLDDDKDIYISSENEDALIIEMN